jgi:Na+/proline symporter/signal transduction histidine kinase
MSIDILIVVGFLIATFVVGIGQGANIKNIKDYALGGRNFSTGALVATIVATWISGGTFFTRLSKTYSDGLSYVFASFGMPLCFIIIAYVFVPRMGKFLGKISVAEAMGELYGKNIRIIVAVAGVIASVGFIAVQFKVFGNIASYFLNFSAFEGILLAAFIVTAYSALGGIKAVTFTDVLQAFTFGFAVPIIGVMIWNQNYHESISLSNALSNSKFDLSSVFSRDNPELLPMITLMCYYAIPGIEPDIFQRISMGSSVKQVKKAFLVSAVLVLCITIAIEWIPFLLFNVNPNLEKSQLFGYIIDNYAGIVGLRGLVIAGIVAMAMSTADSQINSSSVLFANDVCHPLNLGKNKELLISRVFSTFLGISGIILATSSTDLLDIILTANSFYMPVVTAPVMLTILGFRTTPKIVLIGMVAGLATVFIWEFLEIKGDSIAFSMLINAIFLLGSHYLLRQPGGFIARDEGLLEKPEETTGKILIKSPESDFSWSVFCKKYVPKDELAYIGLGVYLIIYTVTSMYSTQVELGKENSQMILIIYQIMLISGVVFLMYPVWPGSISRKAKMKAISVLWPLVTFYMLVLFNCFFVLVSNFSRLQFAVFTVNLLIISMLLGWRISMAMIVVGSYLAFQLHHIYNPHYNFDVYLGSPGFVITYMLLLIGATIMLFVKPKQDHLEATEAEVGSLKTEMTLLGHEVGSLNEKVTHYSEKIYDQEKEIQRLGATAQKILNNVNHELRLPVGNVMNFSEMLYQGLEKHTPEILKELSDQVYKNTTRLSSMILNMLDLANLDVRKVNLEKTPINFSEMVKSRVQICRNIYLQGKKIDFKLLIDPEIMISVDPNYMRQAIDNLVINAINFSEKGVIEVKVENQHNSVLFTVIDQGIGIPKEDIFDIFTPFKMGSNTESKAEGRGVGLALCKSIVEAHDGVITAESKGGKGAIFKVKLPLVRFF